MNIAAKLATLAGMAVAGLVAPRLTATGWRKVTGQEPPSDEPGESKLIQIVVFAALSAVVATLLQQLTMRGAQKAIDRYEEDHHGSKA